MNAKREDERGDGEQVDVLAAPPSDCRARSARGVGGRLVYRECRIVVAVGHAMRTYRGRCEPGR